MLCPRCKSRNVKGVMFCSECGAPLKVFLDPLTPQFSAQLELGLAEEIPTIDNDKPED